MAISNRIGFRVKPSDERLLTLLAERLERTLSDTVRFAVRQTAREYGLLPQKENGQYKKRAKVVAKMPPP